MVFHMNGNIFHVTAFRLDILWEHPLSTAFPPSSRSCGRIRSSWNSASSWPYMFIVFLGQYNHNRGSFIGNSQEISLKPQTLVNHEIRFKCSKLCINIISGSDKNIFSTLGFGLDTEEHKLEVQHSKTNTFPKNLPIPGYAS